MRTLAATIAAFLAGWIFAGLLGAVAIHRLVTR